MDLIAAHLDALQSHLPGGIGIPLPTKDLLFPTARHLHTTHALLVDTLGLPVELWTPLLMVVPALVLDGLRRLPPRPRATGAVLGIFALLLFPLHVTTESIAGDYVMACIAMCFVLKTLELFFCTPEIVDFLPNMRRREFVVRLLSYPDEEFMDAWCMTLDETPRSSQAIRDRNRAIRTDGRTSSLRLLLLDAPIYYALLTVLNAIMPANPREIYMTWSRLEWRFWLLMNLTGWGAMWLLALSHASMCGAMGVVMGVKMKPMFNRPWLSTSVREWWSRRWNICFKDQYYKIVFGLIDPRYAPTPRIQQKPTKHRRSSSPAQRQPVPRSALAALVTFLFSGLIHDYYAYVTFGRVVTTESTRFFVLHGLLSTVEVVTKARFPWLRRVPTVICIIYVTIVATLTMPLFQGPYLRGEFYKNCGIPYLTEVGSNSQWLFDRDHVHFMVN